MSLRRILCASVLIAEAFVIVFGSLAALALAQAPRAAVVAVGLAGAVGCLIVAGLLRYRWAYAVGSLLQVGLVSSGVVVPAMFVLGGLFAALWVSAFVLAHRAERGGRTVMR